MKDLEALLEQGNVTDEVIDDYKITTENLADNGIVLPVILVVDVSYSMEGEPLKHLGNALEVFEKSIIDDPELKRMVEISLVTFNHKIQIDTDFSKMQELDVPTISASGGTNISLAVRHALKKAEERKAQMKNEAIPYYQPFVIILTDGEGGDVTEVAKKVKELTKKRQINFIPVGIGDDAPYTDLKKFTGSVVKVEKTKDLTDLFELISQSISAVSGSVVGENVALPEVPATIQIVA